MKYISYKKLQVDSVVIRKPKRQMCKSSHWGSKQ